MSSKPPFSATNLGLVAVVAVAGLWWITRPKAKPAAEKPKPPVTIKEDDLGKFKLEVTPAAETRLGVVTGTIERKPVKRVRVYAGEVMAPAGRTILVAAPLGGMLEAPESGVPTAGRAVTKGQPILLLQPLLSPEAMTTFATSQADAEGQVKNARTQLETMKLALDRAVRLLKEEAGSKRSVEESQAQHDVALRSLEAAESRLAILTKAVGDAATGRASPLPITAPVTGLLRSLSALPGQNVPAGGALIEIIDLTQVWVRTAVHVGDLNDLDATADAAIGGLSARPGSESWPAHPVDAPPTANPLAATVDLYYALDNQAAKLTPGQRVGVTVLLQGAGESLTVPWSAVVQDTSGGAWVYEALGERTYQRRRVLVRYAVEGMAVLAAGPKEGTSVVTEGAIELFGAETGFSK